MGVVAKSLAFAGLHSAGATRKASRAALSEAIPGYLSKGDHGSHAGHKVDTREEHQATREELKPFLEGDVGPVVTQMAAASGTDPARYLAEGPGLSVFALADNVVYHTYSTSARGLEVMLGFYPLLDRVPKGRDEEGSTEFWIRRHDEYE